MNEPTLLTLLSDQGTAAHECALCPRCYRGTANQGYAREQASQSDDVNPEQDFVSCQNGALTCCICSFPGDSNE